MKSQRPCEIITLVPDAEIDHECVVELLTKLLLDAKSGKYTGLLAIAFGNGECVSHVAVGNMTREAVVYQLEVAKLTIMLEKMNGMAS
jgi:hypothetical protein